MAGKEKGEFGYLNYRKKLNLIKMIVSFAVVAAVLIIGFIVYKTRANIFTVAAIVLVLPAAKMAVAYFVVLPHKPADNELKEKVESKSGRILRFDIFKQQKTYRNSGSSSF